MATNEKLVAAQAWFDEKVRAASEGLQLIDTEGVKNLINSKEKVYLVDSRNAFEQEVSIIPNAVMFEKFSKEPVPAEGQIVFYCTVGGRSAKTAKEYIQQHPEAAPRVHNYTLSIMAWILGNNEVVDSQGNPTKRVHSMGSPMEFWPEGYEHVRI